MWDYSDKVMQHFLNPNNVGYIEDYDGRGEVGSLACGDALRLTFKLDKDKRIANIKFQTFGCASAIASSSVLTELVKGLTLEEAEKITNQDIADRLGGLPEQKMHCSVMGREALEAAIENYRTGGAYSKKQDGQVICNCFGITDKEIERAVVENGLRTLDEVTNYTKAGGGCESCHDEIEKLINKIIGNTATEEEEKTPKQPKKLTNIQKIQLIQETIEREVRPTLIKDGGDIELIDVEGNQVLVSMRGTCAQCPASTFTLRDVVQSKLREFVSQDLVVVEE